MEKFLNLMKLLVGLYILALLFTLGFSLAGMGQAIDAAYVLYLVLMLCRISFGAVLLILLRRMSQFYEQ